MSSAPVGSIFRIAPRCDRMAPRERGMKFHFRRPVEPANSGGSKPSLGLYPAMFEGRRLTEEQASLLRARTGEIELMEPNGNDIEHVVDRSAYPERLFDLAGLHSPPSVSVVSNRFKTIVEEFEPDTHQFYPTELLRYDTKDPIYKDQDFHIMHVCKSIGIDEFYDADRMEGGPSVRVFASGKTAISFRPWEVKTWPIRRSALELGHMFWANAYNNEDRRVSGPGGLMFSAELFEAVSREILNDWPAEIYSVAKLDAFQG